MSDGIVADVADRLWQAEISRSPISPVTEAHPELGIEDARGEVVATAAGGAVMGHPAAAVAWLVNRLTPQEWRLEPGSLVLSGGLTEPVPMSPGSVVSAEFDGLGTIDVHS